MDQLINPLPLVVVFTLVAALVTVVIGVIQTRLYEKQYPDEGETKKPCSDSDKCDL